MKVESAEPDPDITGNASIDNNVGSVGNQEQADDDKVKYNHDLRASLAIINGFSQALKSSFQELKDEYSDVLEHKAGESDTASSDRLMSLEADCRFCLSRLGSSVDQLKDRLEVGALVHSSRQD